MKLDRKEDIKVLYKVCVSRANWKNKMADLANPSERRHIVLRSTICGPFGLLFNVIDLTTHRRKDIFLRPYIRHRCLNRDIFMANV